MDFQREQLEEALKTLGAVLQDQRTPYEPLAIDGSALLLLGLIDRPTGDLDIIALLHDETFRKLDTLPESREAASRQVGAALGLGDGWLNLGPSSLMDFGLPNGWEQRLAVRQYGGPRLHVPSREDQICFKLYAAVDRGPNDKHYIDLRALGPSRDELLFAARWTVTHDPSEAFRDELITYLASLGAEVSDDDLA
jgi:hypothetical protein